MKNGKSWQINPPALLLYLRIPSPASAFQKLQDHIPFLYFPTRAVPDPPSAFSPAVLPSVFRLPPFRQKLKSHRESSRLQENALTPHPAFLRPHKPQTGCQINLRLSGINIRNLKKGLQLFCLFPKRLHPLTVFPIAP